MAAALMDTGRTAWGVAAMFSPLAIGVLILGAAWKAPPPVEEDMPAKPVD